MRPPISIGITAKNTFASAGSLYHPVNPMTNVHTLHNTPISSPADKMGFMACSLLAVRIAVPRSRRGLCPTMFHSERLGDCWLSKRVAGMRPHSGAALAHLDQYLPVTESAFPDRSSPAPHRHTGILNHATQQASLNTQAMLDAATSTAPGALSVDSSMSVAMTSLSLFTFLLLTPQGWATMYLGLTGFVRAVEPD